MGDKVDLFLVAGVPKQGLGLIEKLCKEHKEQVGHLGVGLFRECEEVQKKLNELGVKVIILKHVAEAECVANLKTYHKTLIIPSYEPGNFGSTKQVLKCVELVGHQCVGLGSWMGAEYSEGKHLKTYYSLENVLKESKINCKCILRFDYYQESFKLQAPAMQNEGVIALATGEHHFHPVSVDDINCALAKLITNHKHKDGEQHLTFYGPNKITGNDVAKVASAIIGTEYKFKDVNREECRKYLQMNEHENKDKIETILDYFDVVRAGKMKYEKNDLKEILKDITLLDEFFKNNVDYFKPSQ